MVTLSVVNIGDTPPMGCFDTVSLTPYREGHHSVLETGKVPGANQLASFSKGLADKEPVIAFTYCGIPETPYKPVQIEMKHLPEDRNDDQRSENVRRLLREDRQKCSNGTVHTDQKKV